MDLINLHRHQLNRTLEALNKILDTGKEDDPTIFEISQIVEELNDFNHKYHPRHRPNKEEDKDQLPLFLHI